MFIAVNVHSYFGSRGRNRPSGFNINKRSLETFAIARWADLRRRSARAFSPNILPLGDFNLPIREPGDPIFDALTARGPQLPVHSTEIGSNLAGDRHYDQIAFFSGETADRLEQSGVFDFDGAVFAELWARGSTANFNRYVRYYLTDHRIFWSSFRV